MNDDFGWDSEDPSEYYGKTIKGLYKTENVLEIIFNDDTNTTIEIKDDGHNCCEHRYMTIDDDLKSLNGQKLVSIKVKNYENREVEYDVHEVAFLEIQGDSSSITIATHNEHNGYYGGFCLNISEKV